MSEQITGRLVVRRIPELAPKTPAGQGTLFEAWRFHAFFTTVDATVMDTVAADKTHRQHAVIEQAHADLKNGPLAHLPLLILSPHLCRGADLHVCVVDGVVDAALAWPLSAWTNEFRGLSSGRVAA